ncbi:autotransporter outer membrane beta-barrel domain-containing protein [Paracoccus ravus]|uniref:autotransporter outer membrane beta-barrel domain-containing protein n=1 Tax=Paracoccus ravus TaxID=2447760 RepID=UPI00106EC1F1|nr:autotransporter outer membrane beta-barrel domain-containing protein [Paracoccus ravus]
MVGGQVHADAATSLLRQVSLVEYAVPRVSGRGDENGQQRVWTTAMTFDEDIDARSGIAGSKSDADGFMMGVTRRFDDQLLGYLAGGTLNGSTASADGVVDTDQVFVTLGGRFGLHSLDQGMFVAANLTAAPFDYESRRQIGAGLGGAQGNADGNLFGASVKLGYDHVTADYRVTPTVGMRLSHLKREAVAETGSELALAVDELDEHRSDLLPRLGVEAKPAQLGNWTVAPALSIAYEHALDGADTTSRGFIEGVSIDQISVFDNADVFRVGASISAKLDRLTISASGSNQDENAAGMISASYAF